MKSVVMELPHGKVIKLQEEGEGYSRGSDVKVSCLQ